MSARDDEITMATATLRAWAYSHAEYLRRGWATRPCYVWPGDVQDAYQALGDEREQIWASILTRAIS